MNYELWNVTEQCTRAYREFSFPSRTRAPQIAVHRGVGRIDRGVKVKGHPKGRPRGLSNRALSRSTWERLIIVRWKRSRASKSKFVPKDRIGTSVSKIEWTIFIFHIWNRKIPLPKSDWEKILRVSISKY